MMRCFSNNQQTQSHTIQIIKETNNIQGQHSQTFILFTQQYTMIQFSPNCLTSQTHLTRTYIYIVDNPNCLGNSNSNNLKTSQHNYKLVLSTQNCLVLCHACARHNYLVQIQTQLFPTACCLNLCPSMHQNNVISVITRIPIN